MSPQSWGVTASIFTFQQVDLCPGGVPTQRVEDQSQDAVLLHRLRVRRPLVVQHHSGVHPGADAAPDLLVPGQYLVQAQHGALGSAADYRVTAGVHGATNVSSTEGEEGATVQQEALGAVILQEPLHHRTVHLTQVLHCTSFQAAYVAPLSCVSSLLPPSLQQQRTSPEHGAKNPQWTPSAPFLYPHIVTALDVQSGHLVLSPLQPELFLLSVVSLFSFFFYEWLHRVMAEVTSTDRGLSHSISFLVPFPSSAVHS